MMRSIYYFIVIFFFSLLSHAATNNSDIKVEIEVLEEHDYDSQSSVYRDTCIQYNKYRLFDVISKITEIPLGNFKFNQEVSNPNINFKAKSANFLEKPALINALKISLMDVFDLDIVLKEFQKNVGVIFCYNTSKLKVCDAKSNIEKSIFVNNIYTSNCMSSDEFVKQIERWYGKQLINNLNKQNVFDFGVHKANNFEEFIDELNYYYAINIRVEKRAMMFVVLNNKE